jgi:tRNA1Val (adenine37-N6)-methyltransferase
MRDPEARRARLQAGFDPPGPPAAAPPDLAPAPDETLDALCGAWRIFQLRRGHRYSADDLLAAWYAGEAARRADLAVHRALDLGSGIGSVGLMVAWQFPEARLVTVEAQAASRALAARSARWNGVEDRYTILAGDLREVAPTTADFDLVTGSPPYFDPAAGVVSDGPQKGPCRFELRGGVEDYCAAAARAVRPGGRVVLVMASAGRGRVVAGATAAGLVVESWCPVVFKAGREPMIDLFSLSLRPAAGGAEGRAGLAGTADPPLVLRAADNERTPAFRAIRRVMGYPPGAA